MLILAYRHACCMHTRHACFGHACFTSVGEGRMSPVQFLGVEKKSCGIFLFCGCVCICIRFVPGPARLLPACLVPGPGPFPATYDDDDDDYMLPAWWLPPLTLPLQGVMTIEDSDFRGSRTVQVIAGPVHACCGTCGAGACLTMTILLSVY